MRTTHTYVVMDVSANAYAQIHEKMVAAEYHHAIHKDGDEEVIDMHGIAVKSLPAPPPNGELWVGVTERGDEVVINHPNLLTNAKGEGYIVFSPQQARDLAHSLLRQAAAAEQPK